MMLIIIHIVIIIILAYLLYDSSKDYKASKKQKEDIENTKGIQEAKERAFNQAAKIKLYQLKCQIEEIFKNNDYDIACDKCSEILKSVVFNKILFDLILLLKKLINNCKYI